MGRTATDVTLLELVTDALAASDPMRAAAPSTAD